MKKTESKRPHLRKNGLKRPAHPSVIMATTEAPLSTQNALLLSHLRRFFEHRPYLERMMQVISGETRISLRIVDWFVTNYAKKDYVVYELKNNVRFKVFNDYKLKLKAYSKKKFDPFCRWSRIRIPFDAETEMETTIGQLNFFKWSIENGVLDYIEEHFEEIEQDMNNRNSLAKRRTAGTTASSTTTATEEEEESVDMAKTRKKREELSVSACKCIKKEHVKIVVRFN
jgi:hypothetical protein